MQIITLLNQKGGVGKTSLCLHLAGAIALAGRRVLAVDNDPQSSLTAGFWGPDAADGLDPAGTIASVYGGDDPLPAAVIRPAGVAGIDLLPGSWRASSYNVPDPHLSPYEDQVRLREFLDQVSGDYEIALIDCPPNLHMASWAAMAASDAYIVPVQPEDFGAQGTPAVARMADSVREVINPRLALAGFVVSMYQSRRAIHQAYVKRLRDAHGDAVFAAVVPEAVDFVEAVTNLRPVGLYKPRGSAARSIRAVADELLTRLAMASAPTTGEAA